VSLNHQNPLRGPRYSSISPFLVIDDAFVTLPLNLCILILNINGPIRAKILHNKRNKRVLQQWGACDVQQIKSEMLMTGYAFNKKEEEFWS
jgi:hypothetical protein